MTVSEMMELLAAQREELTRSILGSIDETSLRVRHGQMTPFLARFQPFYHAPFARVFSKNPTESAEACEDCVGRLDLVFGELSNYDSQSEIPVNRKQPILKTNPLPAAVRELDAAIVGYLPFLHPVLQLECVPLFRSGHHATAAAEANKAVFHHLRQQSDRTGDGAALAQAVFAYTNPVLQFSDLAPGDETKKNEQVGFMELLSGYAKGVRNLSAHSHGEPMEPQKAFEFLVTASLLCRRIDDATAFTVSMVLL